MPSYAERQVAIGLRSVLSPLPDGADIENSAHYRDVQIDFEYFIPATLAELYPEWRRESLDGFFFHLARKTADLEAEFFGLCTLISDQARTPIHLRLQISERVDEVSWLECRLGEAGPHGMIRTKWNSTELAALQVRIPNLTPNDIEWVYQITFGQRRL